MHFADLKSILLYEHSDTPVVFGSLSSIQNNNNNSLDACILDKFQYRHYYLSTVLQSKMVVDCGANIGFCFASCRGH